MSDPLNLQAVENWIAELEKLHTVRAAYYGEERLLKQDITFAKALLAHCRALRAALRPFAELGEVWPPADWIDEATVFAKKGLGISAGDMRRAAAVLASVSDGEAAP